MCSRLVSRSKRVYTFRGMGCHATYAKMVVAPQHVEAFALKHNLKAVVYVYEHHADGELHTHVVLLAQENRLWDSHSINELASRVHMTQLRKERDVYNAMAYLCKEFTPKVWTNPAVPPHTIKERILEALWMRNHNSRYSKQASLVYEESYRRCREAWLPTGLEGASQDPVCSEDPDKYFE